MKEPIKENKHDELLKLLNPLIDFMDENGFSYLFVARKDGKCSRYMRGRKDDLSGMLTGMAENNKCVDDVLRESVNDICQDKINQMEVVGIIENGTKGNVKNVEGKNRLASPPPPIKK